MGLSAAHYDGHCKAVGRVGGFLYGIHNAVCEFVEPADAPVPRLLSWREVDTLCKILEQARTPEGHALYDQMRTMLRDMSAEVRRLNGLD